MNMTHSNYPNPAAYVRQWKAVIALAKTHPLATVQVDWATTQTAIRCRQWFFEAMQNRINTRGCVPPRGKKDSYDFFCAARRDQRRLIDIQNHIRVYQFETPEVRKRFSHLLANPND